ncbi:hypothetical protein OF83DRAFT_55461 [Amylostereum chailletii]|nr:hypothetical protein OF83DRAFT_55461 [Amylostereum chailletii]
MGRVEAGRRPSTRDSPAEGDVLSPLVPGSSTATRPPSPNASRETRARKSKISSSAVRFLNTGSPPRSLHGPRETMHPSIARSRRGRLHVRNADTEAGPDHVSPYSQSERAHPKLSPHMARPARVDVSQAAFVETDRYGPALLQIVASVHRPGSPPSSRRLYLPTPDLTFHPSVTARPCLATTLPTSVHTPNGTTTTSPAASGTAHGMSRMTVGRALLCWVHLDPCLDERAHCASSVVFLPGARQPKLIADTHPPLSPTSSNRSHIPDPTLPLTHHAKITACSHFRGYLDLRLVVFEVPPLRTGGVPPHYTADWHPGFGYLRASATQHSRDQVPSIPSGPKSRFRDHEQQGVYHAPAPDFPATHMRRAFRLKRRFDFETQDLGSDPGRPRKYGEQEGRGADRRTGSGPGGAGVRRDLAVWRRV